MKSVMSCERAAIQDGNSQDTTSGCEYERHMKDKSFETLEPFICNQCGGRNLHLNNTSAAHQHGFYRGASHDHLNTPRSRSLDKSDARLRITGIPKKP